MDSWLNKFCTIFTILNSFFCYSTKRWPNESKGISFIDCNEEVSGMRFSIRDKDEEEACAKLPVWSQYCCGVQINTCPIIVFREVKKKWWLSDDGRKNWSNIVSCLLNCKWVNNLMKINHWTILQQKPQIASSARSTKAHIITILIHQLHKIDREPYWNWNNSSCWENYWRKSLFELLIYFSD